MHKSPLRIAGFIAGGILLSPLIAIGLALAIAGVAICLPFLVLFSPCILGALCCGSAFFDDKNKNKSLSLPIELENFKNDYDYSDKVDPVKITHLQNSILALSENKEGVNITPLHLHQVTKAAIEVKQDLKHNLTKDQYKQLMFESKKLQKQLIPALKAENVAARRATR